MINHNITSNSTHNDTTAEIVSDIGQNINAGMRPLPLISLASVNKGAENIVRQKRIVGEKFRKSYGSHLLSFCLILSCLAALAGLLIYLQINSKRKRLEQLSYINESDDGYLLMK